MPENIDNTPSADIRQTMSRGKNDASDYGVRGPLTGSSEQISIYSALAVSSDKQPEQPEQPGLFTAIETVTPVRVSSVTPVTVAPPSGIYKQAKKRNAEILRKDYGVTSQVAGRLAAKKYLDDNLGI